MSQTPTHPRSTIKRSHEITRWRDTKKSRLSGIMSWRKNGDKSLLLVTSTPKAVKKFWRHLPNFQECETDFWATLAWPKHHTGLTVPDVQPINSGQYCTELKARKFKKAKIDKMLRMNVIEPVQSEWTSSIKSDP